MREGGGHFLRCQRGEDYWKGGGGVLASRSSQVGRGDGTCYGESRSAMGSSYLLRVRATERDK